MLHKYYKFNTIIKTCSVSLFFGIRRRNGNKERFPVINALFFQKQCCWYSVFVLHTVARIRSYIIFDVIFARYHTRIGMKSWTTVSIRTLAQCICVDFVELLLAFTHREQFAWFLTLTLQFLYGEDEKWTKSWINSMFSMEMKHFWHRNVQILSSQIWSSSQI